MAKKDFVSIPQSVSTLIADEVADVFEALKRDIKSHPEGLNGVAHELGVDGQTIRAWWNPKHARSLKVSNLVELAYVCPITNFVNALNTMQYMYARKHKELAEEKAQKKVTEFKAQIGALK